MVFLRPIGLPLTLSLCGLGIASIVESGLALGWIGHSEAPQVGLVLLAVPFPLQLLACVLSYLARDTATGACVGVLSVTWLGEGLVRLQSASTSPDGALGLLLVAAAAALVVSAIAVGLTNPLAAAVFALAGIRFLLDGIFQLGGGSTWHDAGSIVGLLVAGAVLYSVPAFELESKCGGPLLPTLRRGRGEISRAAAGFDQLDRLAREPGVRETI
jgi:uncharacterized protein